MFCMLKKKIYILHMLQNITHVFFKVINPSEDTEILEFNQYQN